MTWEYTDASGGDLVRLVYGDNLDGLMDLQDSLRESVTLAYLDPPFMTGRVHYCRNGRAAFDDRWVGFKRGSYLEALRPRIEIVRDTLMPEGSMVLHVDPKTSHYVKVLCDEIFGADCFASEIIWRYRRWPSKTPNFQRVHDVLLRYVKDSTVRPRFNQLYETLAPSTLATWGTKKQRAVSEKGRRVRSSATDQESAGTPLGDVWELSIVAPAAKERTGYPTQKPLALLDRLVYALTDPGDLILDPYAGSGTTLVSACRLGRRAVGLDSSQEAVEVICDRLAKHSVFIEAGMYKSARS